MIRINLLPYRAKKRVENIRRQVSVFLLSFSVIIVGMFYYNVTLNNKIDELNNKVDEINTEIAKVEKKCSEICLKYRDENKDGGDHRQSLTKVYLHSSD